MTGIVVAQQQPLAVAAEQDLADATMLDCRVNPLPARRAKRARDKIADEVAAGDDDLPAALGRVRRGWLEPLAEDPLRLRVTAPEVCLGDSLAEQRADCWGYGRRALLQQRRGS